jgi:hypothetical protein
MGIHMKTDRRDKAARHDNVVVDKQDVPSQAPLESEVIRSAESEVRGTAEQMDVREVRRHHVGIAACGAIVYHPGLAGEGRVGSSLLDGSQTGAQPFWLIPRYDHEGHISHRLPRSGFDSAGTSAMPPDRTTEDTAVPLLV